MRIAFIGQKGIGPAAPAGGVEVYVEELAPRLAAAKNAVTVYARTYPPSREATEGPAARVWHYQGVRIRQVPTLDHPWFEAVTSSFCAAILAVFGRYDIVNFQGIGPGFFTWLVRLFSPGTKVVVTFHSRDYEHAKWPWFGRLFFRLGERIGLRSAHKVVVVAKHLQKYARERYGIKPIYMPQGVSFGQPAPLGSLARQFGLKKSGYILAVARLEAHKGLADLIAAYRQMPRARREKYKLVIVGDGPFESQLKNLARGQRGIIFTGAQPRPVTQALMRNCYFFVSASRSEGLSIALLEALACGRPALVSNIPANTEVVTERAWQLAPSNTEGFARKIAEFLGAPEAVEAAGRAMGRRVKARHSWPAVFTRYQKLYRAL